MRWYLLTTARGTRRAPNLETLERLLPHLEQLERWELAVVYGDGRRRVLRSGVGPRLAA